MFALASRWDQRFPRRALLWLGQLETEPTKILGSRANAAAAAFAPADVHMMAACNRVPVLDGHTESAFVRLRVPATEADVRRALTAYRCEAQALQLPSAPPEWCVSMQREGGRWVVGISRICGLHLDRGGNSIHLFAADVVDRPQARLDRDRGGGYTVSVGRLRASAGEAPDQPARAFQFTLLSHNTILGAAGSALLNAELALRNGWLQL